MEMQTQVARGRAWPLAETAAAVLLVAALLFGGGSRGVGDMVVHLAAVPVAILGILRWRPDQATRLQRTILCLLLAACALAALQLVPVPPMLASSLPGRSRLLEDLAAAGLEPVWSSMTLDRWGSVRALLSLSVVAAMWVLCSTLTPKGLERLLQIAVLLALPLVLLGMAQVGTGAQGNLHAHEFQNQGSATGLFANRNHMASLLAMLVPVAMVFGYRAQQAGQVGRTFGWYGALVLLLLGAAMTFSRTGVLLATVSAVGMALILLLGASCGGTSKLGSHTGWLAALLGACVAVANYAWGRLIDRFAADPLGDRRWEYIEHGMAAIKAWSPWGSGLGTFREAYAPFEPVRAMESTHALHAHNELVEVAVETGLPGLMLVSGLVVLCAVLLIRAMRGGNDCETTLTKACALAAVTPLGHGLVDYPLRTLTVATVFATVLAYCALRVRAAPTELKKKDL